MVDGRISALLELGAGFNMEYTGIENVYLNGTMMGFSREEIDARLQDIQMCIRDRLSCHPIPLFLLRMPLFFEEQGLFLQIFVRTL